MNSTDIVNALLATRNASSDAFDRILPEMLAINADRLRSVNVDVPTVVARVLGAAPRVLALRVDIVRDAPLVEIKLLDNLEDYAYALQEAHVRCISVGKTPDELRALYDEGESMRTLLRSDGTAAVHRGFIDPARLKPCEGLTGFRNVATELSVLVNVMTGAWPKLQGRCGVTQEELVRARDVADALLQYAGLREQSPEARTAAVDLRERAFTLLVNGYEEARRAVLYLRWYQGDADIIAPSLFAGRHRSSSKDDVVEPAAPIETAAATPAAAVPSQTRAYGPPGSPTSNPFMS